MWIHKNYKRLNNCQGFKEVISCVWHVLKEDDELFKLYYIIDDIVDRSVINNTNTNESCSEYKTDTERIALTPISGIN